MKKFNPDDFFKQVALNSGFSDLQTVKDIYYGMVRTISRELRASGSSNMPDWGKFNIRIRKSRNFLNANTQRMDILPPTPEVKFTPDYKVKKYFYSLGDKD